MEITMIYALIACVVGFAMTWGVGANDLANVLSTAIGSKALNVRAAILIAIGFEFAGAFFGGANVSQTLRNGIINTHSLLATPELLVFGMIAVLLAGTTWMLFASFKGLPVSITNAIVGSLIGLGAIVLGTHAVHWHTVGHIAISWISSPLIAGLVSFLLLKSIQVLILGTYQPHRQVKRYISIYLFLIGMVLSYMTVVKGLRHWQITFTPLFELLIAMTCGLAIVAIGLILIRKLPQREPVTLRAQLHYVEKIFSGLMVLTSCAMVFAHGSNDIAIAVGPMAVVVNYAQHAGNILNQHHLPTWVVALGCAGVIAGFIMYGRRVIETVGSEITQLTPSSAFAATLAAATTVVVSTGTGIPVSATQTLVGGVFGAGMARGIGALNLVVMRNILLSWIVTLPAASGLAIVYYLLLKIIFSH